MGGATITTTMMTMEAASWTKMERRGEGSCGGHAIDHDARVVDQSQYSQQQQQQRHSSIPEKARSSDQQQKYLLDLHGGPLQETKFKLDQQTKKVNFAIRISVVVFIVGI